jgi:ribose-phosphate pyrophosphokinase
MNKNPLVFSLFNNENFVNAIHKTLDFEIGKMTFHDFPDEETVVRIDSPVKDREVIFIASLDRPNSKIAPLLFAAETAKELGATSVGLIAPYLAYMRQDKQFHSGEGITSKYFASLISGSFNWLITIDPHLHRWHSLNDIYSIPSQVLHANDSIANWIKQNVSKPVLIGPDAESAQWVSEIAQKSNSPFLILEKKRHGDNQVEISIPQLELYYHHTPVLVDDIISSAATMIETVKHIDFLKLNPAVCIGVHAIFAGHAYDNLLNAGVEKIITCNTIQHPSNGIDISNIVGMLLKKSIT